MTKENIFYNILLSLISPILLVVSGIKNFSFRQSKYLFIIFFGFFGLTMVFPENTDGTRQVEKLEFYKEKSLKEFLIESKNIVLLKSSDNGYESATDLYYHSLAFFVSRFSTSSSALYLIVSLIYSFFYISSIKKVYEIIKGKWNFIIFILFIVFIFWKSFEGINSIRNWTAAWIYFYGAFSYFQTRERKFILFVLLAPFVHFAYIIFILPFFIILFLGNKPKIYFSILIMSFFISMSQISGLADYFSKTELTEQKSRAYVREGQADDYLIERGSKSFHAKFYLVAGKLFVSILFYFIIVFFGYLFGLNHSYLTKSLASMGLLAISISNFSTDILAVNSRMFNNAGLYVLAYVLIIYFEQYNRNKQKLRVFSFDSLTILLLPLAGIFVTTQWSQILSFASLKIFVSPMFYFFLGDDTTSIKEFLQSFF